MPFPRLRVTTLVAVYHVLVPGWETVAVLCAIPWIRRKMWAGLGSRRSTPRNYCAVTTPGKMMSVFRIWKEQLTAIGLVPR